MKKILILFVACLVFNSCTNRKVKNVIEGWWTIDTIYYKNYNIKTCLISNSLNLKFDVKSKFPVALNNCEPIIKNNYDQLAEIKLSNSDKLNDSIPFRLKIATQNEIFAGTYKIVFYKDVPNHLLKMEIFSDKLYIVCRKGLFDFDNNIGLVDELEKISWTNRPTGANGQR